MKKRSSFQRQPGLDITVTLEQFEQTRNLVEKLAYRSFAAIDQNSDWPEYSLRMSSIEAWVKGKIHVAEPDRARHIPCAGSYFFACQQLPSGDNAILWSMSLS